jgi:RNA polymerase sigma-70 factor, ECF subfamily
VTDAAGTVHALVEHLFRHEAGKLLSTLSRVFGLEHLDLAEEVVQDAMLQALRLWPFHGIPKNPRAWLLQVARNKALDLLRRRALLRKVEAVLEREHPGFAPDGLVAIDRRTDGEIEDDQLAMIFACCHPSLPMDARVALTLKVVGGFSVPEIARAFLKQEAAIAQRLVRAKRQLAEQNIELNIPSPWELPTRLDAVLHVLYLLFNEGYAAHQGEDLVRFDLCGEALRLSSLLVHRSDTALPVVHALMALLLLQASRLPARINDAGDVLLLEDQDRARWDQDLLQLGMYYLDKSIAGEELTTFHIQAGIAGVHAVAPSYEQTDWPRLKHLYDCLMELEPTCVVALNRTVAVAMVDGPEAGLHALEEMPTELLAEYHWLHATRADFLRRLGRHEEARREYDMAVRLCGNEAERRFLARRREGLSDAKDTR